MTVGIRWQPDGPLRENVERVRDQLSGYAIDGVTLVNTAALVSLLTRVLVDSVDAERRSEET